MAAPTTPEAIRAVNTRYHDGAASDYDAKWGIDWGETGREQVLGKVRKALGGRLPMFERSLDRDVGKILPGRRAEGAARRRQPQGPH